jgi:hypothetical protein
VRFARMLLCAAAGPAAEFVLGDLEEEFHQSRRHSFWYIWQVLRSVAPLLAIRIRAGELTALALRVALGVAFPLALLDRLWSFVYSQIPLKDGLSRAPEHLALNVVCLLICIAIARPGVLAALTSASLVLAISAADAPIAYVCIMLLAAPTGALFTRSWRKSR